MAADRPAGIEPAARRNIGGAWIVAFLLAAALGTLSWIAGLIWIAVWMLRWVLA